MRKLIAFIAILFINITINPDLIQAKVLPRFQKSVKRAVTYSSGPSISAKLRADRKALNLYISNANKAGSISYTLSYRTNGVDQGVAGTIDPGGQTSLSRELLFGTCSSGVCRYHTGITNAVLEVTSTLTSGKRVLKRFRIKV